MFRSRFFIARYLLLALALIGALFIGLATPALAAGLAQQDPSPIVVTPEFLSAVVAVLASLFFAYVPGIKQKYATLADEWKAAVMAILLFVIAGATFAIGCAQLLPELQVTCDRGGAVGLIYALVAALTANQATYLLAVKPFKPTERAISQVTAQRKANSLSGLADGRTVYYVTSQNGRLYRLAATVVHVWNRDIHSTNPGMVNLFVPPDMYDFTSYLTPTSVVFDPTGAKPNTWHWPEHVA